MNKVELLAWHESVRLSVFDNGAGGGFASDINLSPAEARKLAADLLLAAKECESNLGETR